MLKIIRIILIVIIFLSFIFMFITKANHNIIIEIIKRTIKRYINNKLFYYYFVLPIFISFSISSILKMDDDLYDHFITISSLFIPLFLTVISILTSKTFSSFNEEQKRFIRKMFDTLYFLMLLSTFMMILSFLASSVSLKMIGIPFLYNYKSIIKIIVDSFLYYLLIEILINLLFVLHCIEQVFLYTYDKD